MTDNLDVSPPVATDPIAEAIAEVDDMVAQTPENVRNTPEFKALETRARKSAREAGTARKAEMAARGEAETFRQAAEAERLATLEAQIEGIPEGARAAYQELTELGQKDPVAAANRLAELLASAQSAQVPAPDPTAPAAPAGGTVPAQAPPPLGSGADGNQPLTTPPGEDLTALTGRLDERYAAVVTRNQAPETRNRVTMRERGEGMIAYLASAYIKALGRDG